MIIDRDRASDQAIERERQKYIFLFNRGNVFWLCAHSNIILPFNEENCSWTQKNELFYMVNVFILCKKIFFLSKWLTWYSLVYLYEVLALSGKKLKWFLLNLAWIFKKKQLHMGTNWLILNLLLSLIQLFLYWEFNPVRLTWTIYLLESFLSHSQIFIHRLPASCNNIIKRLH